MNQTQQKTGFTIIEVVLVLAIAGLIFLMVFIALPALQSSQRDQARKSDVSTMASSVSNFTGNNRGKFPTTTQLSGKADGTPDADGKFGGYAQSVSTNITKIISVPTSGTTAAPATRAVADGEVVVIQGTRCAAVGTATSGAKTATQNFTAGSARQFTVTTFIEAGGGSTFCQDS